MLYYWCRLGVTSLINVDFSRLGVHSLINGDDTGLGVNSLINVDFKDERGNSLFLLLCIELRPLPYNLL